MFDSGMLDGLNAEQRAAVLHDEGPLLVLAGAGSGKTRTLAHRVARLAVDGVPAERILLLTFTRRAAQELLRRAGALLGDGDVGRVWGGTFHAVGHRLLRRHGQAVGLGPDFAVLDAGDAADLLDLLRDELGLADGGQRAPRKGTLAEIYTRVVNTRQPLRDVVAHSYPWCRPFIEPLADLFRAYTRRKRDRNLLDYDDLLLYWRALLADPAAGPAVAGAFDHVLVDEYQDTNALQGEILGLLRADLPNLTAVGDDAQAIYAFRGASVDNLLEFPARFAGTRIIRLEQNYRSVQPILDAANAVNAAGSGFAKTMWTRRPGGARPVLTTCRDEAEQSERVVSAVLDRREQGTVLREQAVLFRTGHHSGHLEIELSRRNVPFVKFGGLRFLEAAHVKDLLALLRLPDQPGDELAWFRCLQLVDGVGPATARRMVAGLGIGRPERPERRLALVAGQASPEAQDQLAGLGAMVAAAADSSLSAGAQVGVTLAYYRPLCARVYPDAAVRLRDLEQLELVAAGCTSRQHFVADLVLDPPASTGDLAGPPLLDEDYLTLSTIHSAKGLEWEAVHLIHAADGMLPSDMATGTPTEIEEERRLLYVALTRARTHLHVHWPLRYYHQRLGPRDAHGYAQLSRFLTGPPQACFDVLGPVPAQSAAPEPTLAVLAAAASVDALLEDLWSPGE